MQVARFVRELSFRALSVESCPVSNFGCSRLRAVRNLIYSPRRLEPLGALVDC